ncbi:hypothetical protein L226DRAFT_515436 [Lentinus tigrinus ALCF2SS1-7]|uniref:uncharacterized protein n=1 Tax=Lentinus tigrinus ALCF2SS1-7 TaxID=1328758 RepID=UPI001165EB2D|nr:hypothetical protein L226DRAFT_515436 [Lentinus tigrinus ALCF2SS1-7]
MRKVWYADGNMVVVAENTAFRLHKSVAALQSKNLGRIFQPTNSAPEDMFGGLPVVRMPDTAYDIEQFLVVVYDSGYVERERNIHTVVDFAVFAAWLRDGHKYQLQALVLEAKRGFRSIFPMDLSTWTRYHFEFDGSFSHPRVRFGTTQAIEAINVIRPTGKVHLLPGALYTCAQLPPSVLFPGITRADGSLEMPSSADLQLCFKMKERLRAAEPQIAVRT